MKHLSPAAMGVLAVSWLAVVMLMEWRRPARPTPPFDRSRKVRNLLLAGLGILVTHLVPGGTLLAVAAWGQGKGLGVLHALPPSVAVPLAVLGLDLALWGQHRASHAWGWFWRLHEVHHGDTSMDATTAFRFHPIELVVSMGWKALAVIALGASPAAVGTFEALLLVGNIFEHANVDLPAGLERVLRWGVVTPGLHLVHHSARRVEQNSNFGFFLSIWDRAFGYLKPGADGNLLLGLGESRSRGLIALLRQPFEAPVGDLSGRLDP